MNATRPIVDVDALLRARSLLLDNPESRAGWELLRCAVDDGITMPSASRGVLINRAASAGAHVVEAGEHVARARRTGGKALEVAEARLRVAETERAEAEAALVAGGA
jgi:hypothetical protein